MKKLEHGCFREYKVALGVGNLGPKEPKSGGTFVSPVVGVVIVA